MKAPKTYVVMVMQHLDGPVYGQNFIEYDCEREAMKFMKSMEHTDGVSVFLYKKEEV